MRVTCTEKSFIVRVFDDDGPNYSAICTVEREGPEGRVIGICGKRFYAAAELVWNACESRGITSLQGCMTKAHARLLEGACRRFAKVSILRSVFQHDFPMVEVLVERIAEPTMGY